uniref:Putative ribonuclease H-like domain-containing protein n=1 Tax=Tanacetum cinerariifolium TaxID=118510 RepID=A0A699KZQ1_TANCI|nr:putative ribonuclease H-like domain-containing protein [Tanacetum cinerariifolium]
MDVKSAFLYGTINEEVYVMQPPGFQDLEYPARVYKVEKAMHGLHQAPRAWYGTLPKYLLSNGFQRGTIDQTLFIRRQRGDFILVQVYVDDIISGSSNPQLCIKFEALMHEKFQMSAMGELNFFLGLQVLRKEDGIFLSRDKYVGDILKKFGYSDVRFSNTPMDKENPWGKDGTGKDVDLHLYRSMIGSLMYLTASRPDIMFAVCACARHQTIVATSTTEAEYVAAASCCGQVLWIQNQLLDYGLSVPCKTMSKEISTSILRLLHTAKTLDLVRIWLGGDYGNVFLNGF